MESVWNTIVSSGISRILGAVLILLAGVIAIRLLKGMVKKALERSKLEKGAHKLILSLVEVVSYVLLALIVASSLGINVTGVVALASVLTLSVSLALQTILNNVFGGFAILTIHPFKTGDYVDIGGQAGTVQEVNMIYTRLSTPDNKVISIPNSTVSTSQVINYNAGGTRRVEITVSASYDDSTEKVMQVLLKAANVDKVLPAPAPFAGVTGYGDSAVNYVLRVWCRSDDYWDVYFAINNSLKSTFEREGVTMTYPHLNVHFDKQAQ